MATIDNQDLCADLAQALQEFWEDYTGVRPVRVRVVADEQTVAVCLEQVLTPAEREMASTQDGRELLRELEERVLEQAKPYLQQLIEGAMQQEGILGEVHLDVTKGDVLGFFRSA
ncbi:MAG: DUF2294 family protein [Anaerolineae bacterium]|nr:DUF2294 family protein [Anaerolineae bacterium]